MNPLISIHLVFTATASESEWQQVVQRIKISGNELQRVLQVIISAKFSFFSNKKGAYH